MKYCVYTCYAYMTFNMTWAKCTPQHCWKNWNEETIRRKQMLIALSPDSFVTKTLTKHNCHFSYFRFLFMNSNLLLLVIFWFRILLIIYVALTEHLTNISQSVGVSGMYILKVPIDLCLWLSQILRFQSNHSITGRGVNYH